MAAIETSVPSNGSGATLRLQNAAFPNLQPNEKATFLGPLGSHWKIGIASEGFGIQPEHATLVAPGGLSARFLGKLDGISARADLPVGTSVVLQGHLGGDERWLFPVAWKPIKSSGRVLFDRLIGDQVVPPDYSFAVVWVLPDGGVARKVGQTDVTGHADVVAQKNDIVLPWTIAKDGRARLSVLHLRHRTGWASIRCGTGATSIYGEFADLVMCDDADARLSTVDASWIIAYVVTEDGDVARVRRNASGRIIVPEWFPYVNSRFNLDGLADFEVHASLEFRDDDSGEWLALSGTSGRVTDINNRPVRQVLGLQTRVVLTGKGSPAKSATLDNPYR
jgi:hypothetical protein